MEVAMGVFQENP